MIWQRRAGLNCHVPWQSVIDCGLTPVWWVRPNVLVYAGHHHRHRPERGSRLWTDVRGDPMFLHDVLCRHHGRPDLLRRLDSHRRSV